LPWLRCGNKYGQIRILKAKIYYFIDHIPHRGLTIRSFQMS
jgi:hypothetical protein